MSQVEGIYQAVTDLKDNVMGTGSAQSGEEPPSGFQGKGTAEDPYDQGNVEPVDQLSREPSSGIQGKGTPTDPYDAGNAPENPPAGSETDTTATSAQPAIPSANSAAASSPSAASKTATGYEADTRGRGALKAPPGRREEQTEVSPGTLPDGSHAQTSGDRGENYEPGKFSRFKAKLSLGKH